MKKVKNRVLSSRIIATVLTGAVLSVYAAPVWANSGGEWKKMSGVNHYVGISNPSGSDLVIDETNSSNNVYGGITRSGLVDTGDISNNKVTIAVNGTIRNAYGGYAYDGTGAVKNNAVIVDGGRVTADLIGGYSNKGNTEANHVLINSGKAEGRISGAENRNFDAVKNTVTVTGGDITKTNNHIVGAFVDGQGNVKENEVTISGGTVDVWTIAGGEVYTTTDGLNGIVQNNSVTISAADVKAITVYGGRGNDGNVTGNSVKISNGNINGYIYGGFSNGKGDVADNVVVFSGSDTVAGSICGGYSGNDNDSTTGAVRNNKVFFSDGKAKSNVYGGWSETNDTENNSVIINGGIIDSVFGGRSGENGSVTGNSVEITGTQVEASVEGGFSSQDNVNGNSVTITNCDIKEYVYGGESGGSGTVNGNTVVITGGSVAKYVRGGYSDSGIVSNNSVTVNGGTFGTSIFGGWSNTNDATNNTVTIKSDNGQVPIFNGSIFGGYSTDTGKDMRTGNTLNIYTKGLSATNIKNFEFYNFYLPGNIKAGDTILTLTNAGGTDISDGKVNIGVAGAADLLNVNDTFNLLYNANGITADNVVYSNMQQGVSLEYEFTTIHSDDGNSIVATVDKAPAKTTEQAKSPVETQIAAAAFVNSGADTVAGSGITNAVQVAGGGSAEMFGASGGGNMRYKSGSYSDMRGYNLALGFAKAIQNNAGKLTYGPLLEYGWGNYTSHLDSGIRADGNTKYYGIGMIVRQDNNSGLYYEGSVRYGRMDSDYASGDMIGAGGSKVYADYDSSSSYYGAHVGIGKIKKLNETTKADIYAKLLYTHQSGDSVTLGGEGNGEVYDFDAVNSTRARIGARLSKDVNANGTCYAGLAYEYEFDGEATATVKGLSTPSPSIKGSSGMLELGYIIQNKDVNAPAVDIGLQGWSGKKQGFSGNINFIWKF